MLEAGGRDPSSARRIREVRRRRQRLLLALLALALLLAAALLGRRLFEDSGEPAAPSEPAPTTASGEAAPEGLAPVPPTAPEAELEPDEPLPPLAESDAFVRERAAAASSRPELAAWLVGEGLVARFVAAVDNVANGESPRAHLRELAPSGPFEATEREGRYVATQRSWSRYDLVAALFSSLDADACARLHRLLLPLFEESYRELGGGEDRFDDALKRAFRELLRAPSIDGDVEVVPRVRSYHFADPELEALSPAQKHLLRMGPRNVRAIQAKLRELATALGLDLGGASRPAPAA